MFCTTTSPHVTFGAFGRVLSSFWSRTHSEATRVDSSACSSVYNERIVHPGAWNKLVVAAREDDDEAMLKHALIQSRRRFRT